MRRILYVEDAPSVGGSAVCLLELVSRLDPSAYRPFVLFRYDLAYRAEFDRAGVPNATWASLRGAREEALPADLQPGPASPMQRSAPYRFLRSMKTYAREDRPAVRWLARWIRSESFSLVHANNAVAANLAAIAAASRAPTPVVSHQRGYFRHTAFQRYLSRPVARFVCVSRSIAEDFARQGFPGNRIAVVHDGIDVESIRPRARDAGAPVLVGWFGRLVAWKGAETLVEAARLVLEKRPDVRFVIAGDGPELSRLRESVARAPETAAAVELAGFRNDAKDMIAGCDIFVNTSIEPEPLGHSALEAAAFGIPLVTSNCGGLTEIVLNGHNGFLFEPGNPAALAARLLCLIEDAALRRRLGAAARRRAENEFSLARHVRAIETIYEETIGKRSRQA